MQVGCGHLASPVALWHVRDGVEALVERIAGEARPGDVALVMSNGDFEGIHERLLEALAE